MKWVEKDLQMVAEAAHDANINMPLSVTTKEIYNAALQAGFGELDFAAIYSYLNKER